MKKIGIPGTMKIVVLGANGRTGNLLVRLALERAADVTAVVRSEGKCIDLKDDSLTTMVGDPCDPKFLSRVLRGKDVLVSTLGGRTPTKTATSVYHMSAEAIVEAAGATGLKRVLVTSTALLFPPRSVLDRLLPMIVRNAVRSARQMEETLKGADISWTFARCGFLTNNDECRYRAEIDRLPSNGSSVSRVGLASFLIDAIEKPNATCQVFGVSGPV